MRSAHRTRRRLRALGILCAMWMGAAALPAHAMAQSEGPNDRAVRIPILAPIVIEGDPAKPYVRPPVAPEPGKKRVLPLRTNFRARVLASAGAL